MTFRWGSKTKKWQGEAKTNTAQFWRGNQLVPTPQKKKKRSSEESSWFGEPRCKLGSKAWSNSRIQFSWNESKLVPRNLDLGPHLKLGLRCLAQKDEGISGSPWPRAYLENWDSCESKNVVLFQQQASSMGPRWTNSLQKSYTYIGK